MPRDEYEHAMQNLRSDDIHYRDPDAAMDRAREAYDEAFEDYEAIEAFVVAFERLNTCHDHGMKQADRHYVSDYPPCEEYANLRREAAAWMRMIGCYAEADRIDGRKGKTGEGGV